MLLYNILRIGFPAILVQSMSVYAIPIAVDTPAAPFDPKIYKSAPFNPDIPVPFVPPPPSPNSTVNSIDGAPLSSRHELSNPEIRARAAVYRPSVSYFAGLNMGTYTKTGACKSLNDWINDLKKVKSFNNVHFKYTVVHIYTTSQCSALANALQAAQTVGGIKVWAGIWASPASTYTSDKNELGRQILGPRGNLIAGVAVGSEEMYRGTPPSTLAGYIWDVKGMIQNAYGKTNIPVGTSDGIGPLLNGANQPVLDASDVVMLTDYPYYGGVQVDQALKAFQRDWWALGAKMNSKAIIVGETGWPSLGATIGQAVPGTSQAGKYYRAVACWMRTTLKPFFWFEGIDEQWKPGGLAEQRFGVSWDGGSVKYPLTCY
ncbi:hypothetical protein TWF694_007816 [Orbilia ellipsospora]|uniref:glucan endo-1,3-beta-D-glucosidase n=1 Tax=Orbilia ellipsospora TaxID=2528407 RepID=A0AAV9XJB3_9PEZI